MYSKALEYRIFEYILPRDTFTPSSRQRAHIIAPPNSVPWNSAITFSITSQKKSAVNVELSIVSINASCSEEERAAQAALVHSTERFRDPEWQFNYSGYSGPWIEDIFFDYWNRKSQIECPIGGRYYIPIFFNLCYRNGTEEEQKAIGDYLHSLDTSKTYFTVLLLSKGLSLLGFEPPENLDLLIFAAGGISDGGNITNVPIPLLIEEQALEEALPKKEIFASFAGSLITHPLRQELYNLYHRQYRFHSLQLGNGVQNWVALMKQSVFCISPRGFDVVTFLGTPLA